MRVTLKNPSLALGPLSLAAFLAVGAAQAAPIYHAVELDALGGSDNTARAINNAGQVAGYVTIANTGHAVLYSGGVTTDLGLTGAQGTRSFAAGINDSGQVTGFFATPSSLGQAFIYPNGTTISFGQATFGQGINASQQVTGYYLGSAGFTHAFRYSGGVTTDLGLPNSSAGNAINASGAVTGYYTGSAGAMHAFVAGPGGGWTDLGLPNQSIGSAINAAGQITGWYTGSAGNARAYLYTNGQYVDLGTLGGSSAFGESVNDHGDVAGTSTGSAGVRHAFLYVGGTMYEVEDLLATDDPLFGQIRFDEAFVNDTLQLAVNGCFITGPRNGQCRAFLLTPEPITADVPEPASWTLLAVGLGSLALGKRRRRTTVVG